MQGCCFVIICKEINNTPALKKAKFTISYDYIISNVLRYTPSSPFFSFQGFCKLEKSAEGKIMFIYPENEKIRYIKRKQTFRNIAFTNDL